jgi:hypothetical protein
MDYLCFSTNAAPSIELEIDSIPISAIYYLGEKEAEYRSNK